MNIFKNCGWIWYDHYGYEDVNVFMLARKSFSLRDIPKTAEINITADSRYKLYVNGEYVCYGPARGFPESYPFDRIDIKRYLKKGENVIAVVVWQWGHGTFQSIYAGGNGLIVDGKIGKVDIGTKINNGWLVKKCPAHKQDMPRRSVQIGYQEYYDARKISEDWMLPETNIKFDRTDWQEPTWRKSGCAPWFKFEERGIPLLKEEKKFFKKILHMYYGNNWKNWEKERNLTIIYLNELNGKEDRSRVKDPENMLFDNEKFIEILPFPENKKISFIIDYGEEVAGFIGFEIIGNGGEVLDITTTEVCKDGWPFVGDPLSGSKIAMSDRYIARNGKQQFETFSIHGFRYLCLTIRNIKENFKIKKIYVRSISYPFQEKVVFNSSDETINKIWDMCVRTQICCSFDSYVDCPWREQAQWWGDARVQGANTYYLFGDMRLFRRGIKQAGQSQIENGLTYGTFPSMAVGCILPDYTLTWVHTHLDYYKYTGDISLLTEQFDKIEKAISFFDKKVEENYLLPPMPEWWVFLDWAPLYKEGFSCLFNLMYLYTLKTMVEICKILKREDRKNLYEEKSNVLEKRIDKIFWDKKKNVYFDGYDIKKKKIIKKISQHTHTYAILLNLKKEYHKKWIEEILLPPMKEYPLKHPTIIEGSPFFYYYIIEVMKKVGGYEKEIIDFIKRRWGKMIEEGATTCWEVWKPEMGLSSLCHAWSAHPAIHFIELIAGVKPIAKKREKVKIKKPQFVEKLYFKIKTKTEEIEIVKNGKNVKTKRK
ncbi:MAG TPA: trehalase family glycosidase [Candidatus Ratteibacteria bacterium]|nr:trehalase family glycosidase [Candidatus Ratteibacteria bacterium]